MIKKQSRRTYPKAFREEAVALVTEQGYSVAKAAEAVEMTTSLVSRALIKAYNIRQPPKGLVFHSDRGSQYTSKRYRRLLKTFGIRASMGDVGACWDNAVVERFFGSLKHDWFLPHAHH